MSSQTPSLAPKSGIGANVLRKAVAPLLSLASATQRPSCFPIPASRSEIAGLGLNNLGKAVAPLFPMCPQLRAPHVVPDPASRSENRDLGKWPARDRSSASFLFFHHAALLMSFQTPFLAPGWRVWANDSRKS